MIDQGNSSMPFEQTTNQVVAKLSTQLLAESSEVYLDCYVGTDKESLWPEFRYCQVSKVDLTAKAFDRNFIFNVSNETRSSISVVIFWRCDQVEFIPKEVLQQFPALNGLQIFHSAIPVLKNGLFPADFVRIEYLSLRGNRIQVLESETFKFLTKLKYINLVRNELKQINDNIFANNHQLEYISLFGNSIENMNENLFDDLSHLKFVDLERNECIDHYYGCVAEKCSVNLSLLKTQLSLCFLNDSKKTFIRDKHELKLSCGKRKFVYEPEHQYCEVSHADLSSKNTSFTFAGSKKQLMETTGVEFWQSSKVKFIPLEIFEQFPSLNGLTISLSKIPILKNDLFSKECDRIKYLSLADNKIEKIESLAFQYLWKLKWINLSGNQIKTLVDPIFFYNFKLQTILFSDGYIEMISPKLFESSNNLKVIGFRKNKCTDDFITSKLNIHLPLCYSNCEADQECAVKSVDDKKLVNKAYKCDIYTKSYKYWPEFKYCELEKVNLSKYSVEARFTFNVAENTTKNITAVRFFFSREVDFIPIETFQQFPELNGLIFTRCKIRTLSELFPIHFKQLEYLNLGENRIQTIEPLVFKFLTELKWLNLYFNDIKTLPNEILINNLKLIYVSFYDNQNLKIDSGIISDLSPLEAIDLRKNIYIDKLFSCDNTECPIKFSRLNLSECFTSNFENKTLTNFTEIELKCEYFKKKEFSWPEFQYCRILHANLSIRSHNFIFSRTKEQERQTTVVEFWNSPVVNFIPVEMFQQFPELNGLWIILSNITTLKNDLFTIECQRIEILYLGHNEIEVIEAMALKNLTKLKWISLERNLMKSLNYQVFAYYNKLTYISFYSGSIEMINKKLFIYLTDLKYVDLRKNECADVWIGCGTEKCIPKVQEKAQQCFENCDSNQVCKVAIESRQKTYNDIINIDKTIQILNCTFEIFSTPHSSKFCKIERADLTNGTRNAKFIFTGSEKEKNKTTGVYFHHCFNVDFIPALIFKEFPLMNILSIYYSYIPFLSNSYFPPEFDKIEYLDLKFNQIEKIESLAFQYLWKLKWIDLSGNLFKSLVDPTFFYNFKLQTILFVDGYIEMISPKFFESLKNLKVIDLRKNKCANETIISKNNSSVTKINLPLCYSNCKADQDCATKSVDDTKLMKKTLKCTISTSSHGYWPEYKYCNVEKVDLSKNSLGTQLTFDVPENTRKNISIVQFKFSQEVDFISMEAFQQFPELNGLIFTRCKIGTLKKTLFPVHFKQLEFLDLSENRIQIIEPLAFQFLTELKWLNLNFNHLKTLPDDFLINNLKLIYVSFYSNKMEKVNPGIISDLSPLKFVDFAENTCVKEQHSCGCNCQQTKTCVLKFSELNFSKCNDDVLKTLSNITEVKCRFFKRSHKFWPEFQYCYVPAADFSDKSREFIFIRTKEEEKETTVVEFWNSPVVNFIPVEMFQQFPALNGLKIHLSSLPTLKSDLFTIECERIEFLDLGFNDIEVIEAMALKNLTKLKWIRLEGNLMKSLNDQIFAYNNKLTYIDFGLGNIDMINKRSFFYLRDLRYVNFEKNECANAEISCGSENCIKKIHTILSPCFEKCDSNGECRNASESRVMIPSNNTKAIQTLNCKFQTYSEPYSAKFCEIENTDLTNNTRDAEFKFKGSKSEKRSTTAIRFSYCFDVDFIPAKIFKDFPLIDRLSVNYSYILILNSRVFSSEFDKIEFLELKFNEIRIIEPEAFQYLTRLKEIDLSYNGLEALKFDIFKSNRRLKNIYLENNKIKMLNTNLFHKLNNLLYLDFEKNDCIDRIFVRSEFKNIKKELSICYKNCESDEECNESSSGNSGGKKETRVISCTLNIISWKNKKICFMNDTELRSNVIHEICGIGNKADKITAVYLKSSRVVEIIPTEIVQTFPNMDSIAFEKSNIPILKAKIFTSNFRKIEEILLKENGIQQIEDEAFHELENLREIDLSSNNIKSINKEIFIHNSNLRTINLYGNKIFLIQRDSFKRQVKLEELSLLGNECISTNFGCDFENCQDVEKIDDYLENCHLNYTKQETKLHDRKLFLLSNIALNLSSRDRNVKPCILLFFYSCKQNSLEKNPWKKISLLCRINHFNQLF